MSKRRRRKKEWRGWKRLSRNKVPIDETEATVRVPKKRIKSRLIHDDARLGRHHVLLTHIGLKRKFLDDDEYNLLRCHCYDPKRLCINETSHIVQVETVDDSVDQEPNNDPSDTCRYEGNYPETVLLFYPVQYLLLILMMSVVTETKMTVTFPPPFPFACQLSKWDERRKHFSFLTRIFRNESKMPITNIHPSLDWVTVQCEFTKTIALFLATIGSSAATAFYEQTCQSTSYPVWSDRTWQSRCWLHL